MSGKIPAGSRQIWRRSIWFSVSPWLWTNEKKWHMNNSISFRNLFRRIFHTQATHFFSTLYTKFYTARTPDCESVNINKLDLFFEKCHQFYLLIWRPNAWWFITELNFEMILMYLAGIRIKYCIYYLIRSWDTHWCVQELWYI